MNLRFAITICLSALLLLFQSQIWTGERSHGKLRLARAELAQVEGRNAKANIINQQLQAEVDDLREGLEIIEEHARHELNMVKKGEILVVYQ